MAVSKLPKPDFAKNMKIIGHSDQGGRPDGVQLMVNKGFAYIGHMFSKGFSVVDVRDPKNPKPVEYVAAPHNTWNLHLQTFGDLLLVVNAKDMFAAAEFQDEKAYYTGQIGKKVGTASGSAATRDWTAGMAVYDISTPGKPRKIGFMAVQGGGVHRIWYTGGRYAYASALLDGFTDYIFITIDMKDPANPVEVGRYWLPGMNEAAGEVPTSNKRAGLHHATVSGDVAYGAWRDAGLVLIDIKDHAKPKLILHKNWSPPYNGGTHNVLALPDRDLMVVVDEAVLDNYEDGFKPIWMFDVRDLANPMSISTFPEPTEDDYKNKGGHFGPHNIYENRPDGFVSSNLIFASYQNAGVRIFDISNAYQPKQAGAFVPPEPLTLADRRPNRRKVIQTCDVYVDKAGLVYANDYNGGLYILEYQG